MRYLMTLKRMNIEEWMSNFYITILLYLATPLQFNPAPTTTYCLSYAEVLLLTLVLACLQRQ